MEIKVLCLCGQKFAFDVEPVNDRMPYTVTCPVCGTDGTGSANSIIASRAASAPPAPPPLPVAPTGPDAPITIKPAGLRLSASAHAPAATAAPVTIAASTPAARPPTPTRPVQMGYMPKDTALEYSFGLGVLGAFIGAFLGSAILFVMSVLMGFKFPLFGFIVGGLTGWCAKKFCRGTSNALGGVAAGLTLVCVGLSMFLMFDGIGISSIISIIIGVSMAWKIAGGE